MRNAHRVIFLAIDPFLTLRGKPLFSVEGFLSELQQRDIPCVWLSARSRAQLDEPRRKLGHDAPFIAESGSGVYLPEDYFHLKPEKTVRLGRFTCLPVAEPQPAAREALEALSLETGVTVVPLHSLSHRELMQNTGLPRREAELCRLRDFSELFFFAGAGEQEIANFLSAAAGKKLVVRKSDALWSLSPGADEATAIRDVSRLYDRALRSRVTRIGVGTAPDLRHISSACDHVLDIGQEPPTGQPMAPSHNNEQRFQLGDPELWDAVLSNILARSRP